MTAKIYQKNKNLLLELGDETSTLRSVIQFLFCSFY